MAGSSVGGSVADSACSTVGAKVSLMVAKMALKRVGTSAAFSVAL